MSWLNFLAEWNWKCNPFGSTNNSRGLWVWYLDHNKQAELLKFCQDKKISEIYVSIPEHLNKQQVKVFLEASHQLNLKVEMLYGAQVGPKWDENSAIDLIKSHYSNLPWDGIHLDLEINKATPEAFNSKFGAVLNACKGLSKVKVDVEWWRKDSEYWDLINKADSMCVMGYATNYWSIKYKTLKAVNRTKIPFFLSVETGEGKEFSKVSFWTKGESKMEKEIGKLNQFFSNNQRFKGIAIHHYSSYKDLK